MVDFSLTLTKEFCIELLERDYLENILEHEIKKYLSGTDGKYHVYIISCNLRKEFGDILFRFIGYLSPENIIHLGDIAKKLKVEVLTDGSKDIVVDIKPPVLYIPKNNNNEKINLEVHKLWRAYKKKMKTFYINILTIKLEKKRRKNLDTSMMRRSC